MSAPCICRMADRRHADAGQLRAAAPATTKATALARFLVDLPQLATPARARRRPRHRLACCCIRCIWPNGHRPTSLLDPTASGTGALINGRSIEHDHFTGRDRHQGDDTGPACCWIWWRRQHRRRHDTGPCTCRDRDQVDGASRPAARPSPTCRTGTGTGTGMSTIPNR